MKVKCLSSLLFFAFNMHCLFGQQYNLVRQVSISLPVHVTADPIGHVYVQSDRGDVVKFNLDGEKLAVYHTSEREKATTLDASLSLRLFTFYKDAQTYQYFDRQLNPSSVYQLPEQQGSFFSLAAPSSDNSLWLWDATLLSLKKYKPVLNTFIVETPSQYYLNSSHDIGQIKEYQNKVYLNDRNHQVMVFDILGNYIQKLPVSEIDHFGFYRDELYWWEGTTIYLYHLYEMHKRTLMLPDIKNPLHILLHEDRLVVFTEKQMLIYRILSP